jgi:hypothetical protein
MGRKPLTLQEIGNGKNVGLDIDPEAKQVPSFRQSCQGWSQGL